MLVLPKPLRAILLDLDGTLYEHGPVRKRMAFRLLRAYAAHPLSGRRTMRAIQQYRKAQELLRVTPPRTGDLAGEQLRFAAAATGQDAALVEAAVRRWMETEPLDLLPGAARPGLAAFLETAGALGLRLAICSDYPAPAKLDALGIRHCFSAVVCAQDADVQRFKPDPCILRTALERLAVPPAAALYIGDRDEVDGAAAAAAGVPFLNIERSSFTEVASAIHREVVRVQTV